MAPQLKLSLLFYLALLGFFVASNGFPESEQFSQGEFIELSSSSTEPSSLSSTTEGHTSPGTDYGQIIGNFLLGHANDILRVIKVIQLLGGRFLVPESYVPRHIFINLTEFGLNNSLGLEGEINLRNVAIAGLGATKIPISILNINGIFNPIPIKFQLLNEEFRIEADYDVNASIGNFIPVRGEGVVRISFNLTAGLDVEIKAKLGSPTVMEMPFFDYTVGDLREVNVDFDGLWGDEDEEVGSAIGVLVNAYVNEYVTPVIVKMWEQVQQTFIPIPPIIFNSLKLTFAQFLDLVQQIVGSFDFCKL